MSEARRTSRRRRALLHAAGAAAAGSVGGWAAASHARTGGAAADAAVPGGAVVKAPRKTLRYVFPFAETGFDPAQVSDGNSNTICAAIFEAPLRYDYLARPAVLKPRTALRMPEVSPDFRTYTVRIRPGIFFADDPAFQGRPRELTAADYVYAWKRHYDPRWKSPNLYTLENAKIPGMAELRKQAQATGRFDYDREVEGIRALDRHTFQIRLGESDPRFIYNFASVSFAAVAREVVDFHGDKIMANPVGTGAFRLAEWRRSSRIVLERNPRYREERYDEQAPPDDPRSQAIAARLRGQRLPLVDRVEIHVVEESQPRWLAFLNHEHDLLEGLPPEYAHTIIPNGRLAPNLVRAGVEMDRIPLVDIVMSYFGMENPVVGGYEPHKVALRRAISLAYDNEEEIRQIRKNQMIAANSPIAPLTWGYDPGFVSEASQVDLARARALLDTYGYVDRDGDGWREQPDGSPLEIVYSTGSTALDRQYNELWKKSMNRLGLRLKFDIGQWPEQLKASRNGKLMMWGVAWVSGVPDGQAFLELGYSRNKGQANHARFDLPAYDALFERQRGLPDGPERAAAIREMKRLFVTYMPYKMHGHRIRTDLTYAHVIGYRRHPFMRAFFEYVDIDAAAQANARSA